MANHPHDFDEVKRKAKEQAEEVFNRAGMMPTSPFTAQALQSGATKKVRIKQFRCDSDVDVAEMEDIMTRAANPSGGIVIRREDLGRDSSGTGVMILNWIEIDMADYKQKYKEKKIEGIENFILSDKLPVSARHPDMIPDPPNAAKLPRHMLSIDEIIEGMEEMERQAAEAVAQSPDLKELFPANENAHQQHSSDPGSYEPVFEEDQQNTEAPDGLDGEVTDDDVETDGGML
jgi:hypothetical protein